MKKVAWALTAAGLALSMLASTVHAGGWHGHHGHGCGGGCGSFYYGNSSSDAAIVAAALFGTAALVNAFTVPRYSAPPPAAYYPPPPPAYYPPTPVVYLPPPPVVYYPPPPPGYYPRAYYYAPR